MIFFCAELSTNKGVLSMQNIFLWELVRVSDEETKLQGGSNEKISKLWKHCLKLLESYFPYKIFTNNESSKVDPQNSLQI